MAQNLEIFNIAEGLRANMTIVVSFRPWRCARRRAREGSEQVVTAF